MFPSPGDPDFNGPNFDVLNGELYFDGVIAGGEEPSFGQTYLWKSNGSASGTSVISGVKGAGYPGVLGFDPSAMTTVTLPSAPTVTGVAFTIPNEVFNGTVSISGSVNAGRGEQGRQHLQQFDIARRGDRLKRHILVAGHSKPWDL